jgi:MFS transporter, ACS family, D-galactonate transporter
MNRRWILLALIFTGILIAYVDRGNLSLAATSVMRDFGIPPSSMGVLLSAFFWTYGIFQIPAGLIVDRFGIRRVYAASFLIWSLASAGVALSRNSSDIISLRMLLGFAETAAPVASIAFIRRNFSGSEQGLPTAIYIAGQTLGPACGTLVGSMLLARFGWRFLFAATGIGALLWIPFWWRLAPADSSRQIIPKLQRGRIPWRSIFSNRAFWAISLCSFFLAYYWYFILTWMPAYLTMARGFSTLGMGQILSAPLFIMALVNILSGWTADKLGADASSVFRIRVRFAAAGLLGAALIVLLDTLSSRGAVLPILTVSICSFGIANSSFWAIAQHVSPAAMVGRAIGFLNTVSQVGGIVAPLITGWSLGPQKNFRVAIALAAISPLVSCVLLLVAGSGGLEKLKERLGDRDVVSF